jgi:hypothetical protein
MTRKTSTYARKRKATSGEYDSSAWCSTVQRCRPYAAESLEHMGIADTMPAATKSMIKVREAYVSIKQRQTAPVNTHDFDLLTHAMAVTTIRAIQIAGGDLAKNPMLQTVVPANAALRRLLERRRATGVWGFDGPAIDEIAQAIEIYETIISAGTPGDMLSATDLHAARKFGCVTVTLDPLDVDGVAA